MELDKQFVLDELRKAGQNQQVENAVKELPEKIDHDQHAALLQKFGLDPGKLVEKATERGSPVSSVPLRAARAPPLAV